jgi:hypothetical protein
MMFCKHMWHEFVDFLASDVVDGIAKEFSYVFSESYNFTDLIYQVYLNNSILWISNYLLIRLSMTEIEDLQFFLSIGYFLTVLIKILFIQQTYRYKLNVMKELVNIGTYLRVELGFDFV